MRNRILSNYQRHLNIAQSIRNFKKFKLILNIIYKFVFFYEKYYFLNRNINYMYGMFIIINVLHVG